MDPCSRPCMITRVSRLVDVGCRLKAVSAHLVRHTSMAFCNVVCEWRAYTSSLTSAANGYEGRRPTNMAKWRGGKCEISGRQEHGDWCQSAAKVPG
jgi:hypothetical protein